MEILKIVNAKKTYQIGNNELNILENINLNVQKGEFISILGKSGAGKSTLLYLMSGLLAPNSGSVWFDGEDIYTYNDLKMSYFRNSEMGFIFQSFFLESSYNAWENVALPLIVRKTKVRKRREMAYEVLKKVGLEGRETHRPSQLSGGEQQRVCIARALVGHPKILFADEPTGNLDKQSGENIIYLLKELANDDTAVVLVTHDEQTAQKTDRIIHISDGKIKD